MDALTEAGYEAYHVTTSNYANVEATLKTDFRALGLDTDGSYIVVVSGEEVNTNSRIASLPEQDLIDPGGGSNISYLYDGRYYTMRYLTIAPAANTHTAQSQVVNLLKNAHTESKIKEVFNSLFAYGIDEIHTKYPLRTIASIFGIFLSDLDAGHDPQLELCATASWTRVHVQIYQEGIDSWETRSIVDYVAVQTLLDGRYYSKSENRFFPISDNHSEIFYSEHYWDYEWRKEQAVIAYWDIEIYADYVGDVKMHVTNPDYFPETVSSPVITFNCSYN